MTGSRPSLVLLPWQEAVMSPFMRKSVCCAFADRIANALWSRHRFSAKQMPLCERRVALDAAWPVCCSSSVVEHSLGKGEVESSILSCSTTIFPCNSILSRDEASNKRAFSLSDTFRDGYEHPSLVRDRNMTRSPAAVRWFNKLIERELCAIGASRFPPLQ
jgi:hypothetical protein